MAQLTLELPDSTFAFFRQTPDELAISIKIAALVRWYEEGKISQSKAAEIAGVSRQEFLEYLFIHHVSPYQISEDELKHELQ